MSTTDAPTPETDTTDIREDQQPSDDLAHRRPWWRAHPVWWVATTVFLAGVVTLALMLNHALDVNAQWKAQVDELTDVSYELGEELTAEREVVASQESTIDLLREQLQTVQQRLLDLAAQVARSDDDAVVTQQRIENLETLVASAGNVANALTRCVTSQEQLVELLREAELYDEAELAAFEESVDRLCAAARGANDQLQEAIAEPS